MKESEIIDRLRQIIEPYVEDKSILDTVTADTDLINDLHINSANVVDIVLDAEEMFDIEISDDEAEQMLTVKDAVRVIQEQLKLKS